MTIAGEEFRNRERRISAMARRSARIITDDTIVSTQPCVRKWRPGHRWPSADIGRFRLHEEVSRPGPDQEVASDGI